MSAPESSQLSCFAVLTSVREPPPRRSPRSAQKPSTSTSSHWWFTAPRPDTPPDKCLPAEPREAFARIAGCKAIRDMFDARFSKGWRLDVLEGMNEASAAAARRRGGAVGGRVGAGPGPLGDGAAEGARERGREGGREGPVGGGGEGRSVRERAEGETAGSGLAGRVTRRGDEKRRGRGRE